MAKPPSPTQVGPRRAGSWAGGGARRGLGRRRRRSAQRAKSRDGASTSRRITSAAARAAAMPTAKLAQSGRTPCSRTMDATSTGACTI